MNLVQSIATSSWIGGFKAISCRHEKCSRWLTQRALSTRRVGVTFDEQWYCSYRCVAAAVEERFEQLLVVPPSRTAHTPRMPIGLLLVSRGLITHDQLRSLSDEQRRIGREMGDLVVELGLITQRQLAEVRAAQWGCPMFSVPPNAVQPEVQVPRTLARVASMLPLHHVGSTGNLLVGFVHAIEYAQLYAIEQITVCKTQPCFITNSDFQLQLQAQGAAEMPEEMIVEDCETAADKTRALCNQGVLRNADRISLTRCRNFIWARLSTGTRTLDLLYRIDSPALKALPMM